MQMNFDFMLRVVPLEGFKEGNDINRWMFLNETWDALLKLDQGQGEQLEDPHNNPRERT